MLYHFSDVKGEGSIEPVYTTLKAIIKDLWFEFIKENEKVECSYSQNATRMLHYTYNCVIFAIYSLCVLRYFQRLIAWSRMLKKSSRRLWRSWD